MSPKTLETTRSTQPIDLDAALHNLSEHPTFRETIYYSDPPKAPKDVSLDGSAFQGEPNKTYDHARTLYTTATDTLQASSSSRPETKKTYQDASFPRTDKHYLGSQLQDYRQAPWDTLNSHSDSRTIPGTDITRSDSPILSEQQAVTLRQQNRRVIQGPNNKIHDVHWNKRTITTFAFEKSISAASLSNILTGRYPNLKGYKLPEGVKPYDPIARDRRNASLTHAERSAARRATRGE